MDGRIYRSGRIEALWEPPGTLPTDSELERKFLWLTSPVLGRMEANRMAEQIWTADQWATIDPIIQGCLPRQNDYRRIDAAIMNAGG